MENKTKDKRSKEEIDATVDEMIRTWDKVRCAICGKQISMLDSPFVRISGRECFICKTHR